MKEDEKLRQYGMTRDQQLNMERCAEFVARMIQKYGRKVLAEIAREKQEGNRKAETSDSRKSSQLPR